MNPDHADIVSATRAWYDREASAYAIRNADYEKFPGLRTEIEGFLESLDPTKGPVLDLGCGAGRDARLITGKGWAIVAADLSETMLRITRAALNESGRSHCVQLDMRRLPLASGSFSGVWACGSLLHVLPTVVPDCLAELHRVLAPRARLAISMKAGDHAGWVSSSHSSGKRWFTLLAPESVVGLLSDHGFVDLSTTKRGRDGWFIAYGTKC